MKRFLDAIFALRMAGVRTNRFTLSQASRRLEQPLAGSKQHDFYGVPVQSRHGGQLLQRVAFHFPQQHQSASLLGHLAQQLDY